MFTLWFERRQRVLLVRISGVMSSQDFETHDRNVLTFLAREGAVRGLYDFSAVDAVAVPISKVMQRGQAPSIIADRVIVAPRAAGEEFARTIRDQQRLAGHREPIIVPTLGEAYALLDLDNPLFEPIDIH
ncbi:MAG: hypothetical protein KIT25_04045 [Enhydrobacter sp.]|nr:MAG: hypothetical protein KIT25_04045 [Enhydrobacter sp.]